MRLIVNADDFGLSKGVNYGIVESFKNGILTSTTMMMNAPAMDHAVELMKQSGIPVGIHLVASMFKPLTKVTSFVKSDGVFDKAKFFDKAAVIDEAELETEWRAQLELFIAKTGQKPTHIDSHHHAHMEEKSRTVIEKLAKEYQLQVRNLDTEYGCHVEFKHEFYGEEATIEVVDQLTQTGDVIELMCHPAYIDNELIEATSYAMKRKDELAVILSSKVKEVVARKKIELISYKDTAISV